MDLSLTEEQQMFRETARDFVDDMVVPYPRDWDRVESMERGITKKLGQLGFLGATIPDTFGGTPCDHLSYRRRGDDVVRGHQSDPETDHRPFAHRYQRLRGVRS